MTKPVKANITTKPSNSPKKTVPKIGNSSEYKIESSIAKCNRMFTKVDELLKNYDTSLANIQSGLEKIRGYDSDYDHIKGKPLFILFLYRAIRSPNIKRRPRRSTERAQ